MESFMMAARVVVPMAIMVIIGVALRLIKIIDAPTMKKVDTLIFKVTMPTLMFYNIYKTDFNQLHNVNYIIYGSIGLIVLFVFSLTVVPKFIHPRSTASSYGQAIMRSNYLVFGAAVAESIYGSGNYGIITLMGAVVVPMFNVLSAILLEAGRHGTASIKKLGFSILINPNIFAALVGLAINFSGVVIPDLFLGVVKDIAGLTTPLSFLSIGVSLGASGVLIKKAYLASAVTLRLIVIPLIFVVGGVLLGFRGQELCALMILFAAPTAVSSYPMAVAMDADGDFAGQMVAFTTIICLPTIFIWTLVLNSLHLM